MKPSESAIADATRVLHEAYAHDVRIAAEKLAADVRRGAIKSPEHLEWALEQEALASDRVRYPASARVALFVSPHLRKLTENSDIRLGYIAFITVHADVKAALDELLGGAL